MLNFRTPVEVEWCGTLLVNDRFILHHYQFLLRSDSLEVKLETGRVDGRKAAGYGSCVR